MRRSVKFRVSFLALAIISYVIGFNSLPESLSSDVDMYKLVAIAGLYFIFLPVLYWFWIIKAGKQKPWKLLLIFSLSGLMARLSFPAEIASYFEFIMWLRYPIIAILLLIEFYLMFSIIKGLWQARSMKGDPRVHIVDKYQDDKKRSLALVLASEPASWYYAIPWFSRQHVSSDYTIDLLSGKPWAWLAMLLGTLSAAAGVYILLSSWSELVAIIVSSIIAYGVVFVTANYRVSKHYSLYIQQDKLVINNSMWGFLAIDIADVERIEVGCWDKVRAAEEGEKESEQLCFGRGKKANLHLKFSQPQTYFGALGQLPEQISELKLVVNEPRKLADELESRLATEVVEITTINIAKAG
ncbi:hypothetical protein JK628_02070 [Shewanella sp. KX20019]|uniref:hypothetical protein n=1 Tax=Shewanella sp. KX20019 TaxID=2803864 RepID=UPI001927D4C7|nr:hypothetical protein [Shewanella sp. KX20019]QQX80686.1 hypothetical protein JK628_02070 [Shewanella sp. KX20019]